MDEFKLTGLSYLEAKGQSKSNVSSSDFQPTLRIESATSGIWFHSWWCFSLISFFSSNLLVIPTSQSTIINRHLAASKPMIKMNNQHHEQIQLQFSELTQLPIDSYSLNEAVQLNDNLSQLNQLANVRNQEHLRQMTGDMMQQRQSFEIDGQQQQHPRVVNNEISHNHDNLDRYRYQSKCTKNRADLDRCTAQLIAFGSSQATYPHNMNELDSLYCPKVKRLIDCIKENSRSDCYSRFDKQVIDWVLSSTRKMSNKRCKNETEKGRFVRMVNSCFEPMDSMKDKCMNNYIGSLDAITTQSETITLDTLTRQQVDDNNNDHYTNNNNDADDDDDISIQLSCCANKRFKSCMMREAKEHCKPMDGSLEKLKRTNSLSSRKIAKKHLEKSMRDMMEEVEGTLEAMSLSGPKFFCRGVTEQFCRKHFDHKYSGKPPRHESILPSLIIIYSQKN